ncbi:MAG: alpha/beta hydrolase-fold protein [bacterium]
MARLSGTNLWYRTQVFEPDARLDYKFVLNGNNWIIDPRNPNKVSGGFGPNSELRMPQYPSAPEIEFYTNIPHGILRDTTFFSVNLGNARNVKIYLPPGYAGSNMHYPIVLFHDGLEYISLANANNAIDYLISEGRIAPIIGVFVPPVNRTDEYAGNLKSNFTAFIVNELLPWVETRYRTKTTPESRAVMGASNGGNISLWLGMQHPEVFGNIAAQSSNIESALSARFQSDPKLNLKLYLDLGTYDIPVLIPRVRNFIPILENNNYYYQYLEFHEGHSWGNWRAHIDNALEMFFPVTTSVIDRSVKPGIFTLVSNYPNPFHPNTTITYDLFRQARVSISVFNILGQKLRTLVVGDFSAGEHLATWDGRDARGQLLPNGIYLFHVQIDHAFVHTGRMILLRK